LLYSQPSLFAGSLARMSQTNTIHNNRKGKKFSVQFDFSDPTVIIN
jgi:hypothetical protein